MNTNERVCVYIDTPMHVVKPYVVAYVFFAFASHHLGSKMTVPRPCVVVRITFIEIKLHRTHVFIIHVPFKCNYRGGEASKERFRHKRAFSSRLYPGGEKGDETSDERREEGALLLLAGFSPLPSSMAVWETLRGR